MAVFRIHKTKDYTVMSNVHFREKEMTLKAKGLLSMMMALPDDWNYSIAGLAALSKDGKDSVMSALNELERFGYLKRTRLMDSNGQFAGFDYDIFEQPQGAETPPDADSPYPENPNTVNPDAGNPPQYNTNISSTKKLNTESIKKERKTDSFDRLIEEYLDAVGFEEKDKIRGLLQDWLKVRKAKRAAMTDRALELNLKVLKDCAEQSNMPVDKYLEAVIMLGWQAFYPIKEYGNTGASGSGGNNPFLNIAKEEGLF